MIVSSKFGTTKKSFATRTVSMPHSMACTEVTSPLHEPTASLSRNGFCRGVVVPLIAPARTQLADAPESMRAATHCPFAHMSICGTSLCGLFAGFAGFAVVSRFAGLFTGL